MCSCAAGWVWTGGRGPDSKPQWWSGRSGPEVAHCCGLDHRRTSSWITLITPSLNQLWRLERCTAETSPNITINSHEDKRSEDSFGVHAASVAATPKTWSEAGAARRKHSTLWNPGVPYEGSSTAAGRDQNQMTLNLSPPTARSPRHIITYFLEIGSLWLFLKKRL